MNRISIFGDKISYDPGRPQLSCVVEDDCRLLILRLELGCSSYREVPAPMLYSAKERTPGFVHVRQALCQLSYSLSLHYYS